MDEHDASRRNTPGLALASAFFIGIALASSGWLGVDRVANARPQDPPAVKPKSAAAQKAENGGLNPAEQRAEMIRVLRSIDRRLETLVERTK